MPSRRIGTTGLAVGLWVLAATAGRAADISVDTIGPDDRKLTVIVVEGDIVPGDEREFANAAITADNALVFLSSPGGSIGPAIEIGSAIRVKGFSTIVVDGYPCASACALIWLGGAIRFMGDHAEVGFHAAYRLDPGKAESVPAVDSVANALVGAYLNRLGLPMSAIAYITEAAPDAMRWLTFEEAERIGIEVKRLPPSEEGDIRDAGSGSQPPSAPPPPLPERHPEDWASYGDWIQIFSRPLETDASMLATDYRQRFPNTFVFEYDNGWYVVAVGPYRRGEARAIRDRLIVQGAIPRDSFITDGKRFRDVVGGVRPQRAGETPGASVEQRALVTTREFFSTLSSSNIVALDFLDGVYPDEVHYFGRPMSKAEVIEDKRAFVERWPVRLYTIRENSLRAACDRAEVCVVTALVGWTARSPARGSVSTGLAVFRLTFDFGRGGLLVAESSEVLSRKIARAR